MPTRPLQQNPHVIRLFAAFLLLVAFAGPATTSGAFAQSEEFRDPSNRLLGRMIARSDGVLEARSASNRLLGTYDPQRNETRRANNTLFGRGNQLSILVYEDARASGIVSKAEPAPDGYHQRQQDRIDRLRSEDNRSVILPEVAARQARMKGFLTQEDRRRAIEAFQLAGENLGREFFWSNPTTGNSGSIILFADQKFNDTYLHGRLAPCFRGRMLLHAGGETDEQRQVVCKIPHNGVWTVTQVEAD